MKNSNVKTSLTRKATAIMSAVTTLSTVAVLTMAPTSQAMAVGLFQTSKKCSGSTCEYGYRAEGGGRTPAAAKSDAQNRAVCPRDTVRVSSNWGKSGSMYNNTWFYADLNFVCRKEGLLAKQDQKAKK